MGSMKLTNGVGIMLLVTACCMLSVNSMRWNYNWTDPGGDQGSYSYGSRGGGGGGGWGWRGGYGAHEGRGGGGWGWSRGYGHGSSRGYNYSGGGSPSGGWGWSGGYSHNYSTGGGGGGGGGGGVSSPGSGSSGGGGWGSWGRGWGGWGRGFNYTYGEGGGGGTVVAAPPLPPPLPTPRSSPGRVIVGGDSQGWNFGFNYSDWAEKNSPFYYNDVLVFKYEPPRNGSHPHSVYMLPDMTSYQNCDFSKGRRIATPTQGNGEGFEFVLRKWQTYYFACGESNGFHCRVGMMKFTITPAFSWK